MKLLKYLLILLLLVALSVGTSHADMKKVAQTGFQFLKLDASARPAAMGGAYMMVGDDATALFYNPAGLALMESSYDVMLNRTNWIADISYDAFGASANFGNFGSFGVSYVGANYGDIMGTQVASNEQGYIKTGMLEVGAYAMGIAYSRSLTDKFTLGGQIKYATQHLGESQISENETVENEVSTLAYDFGTIFYPGFKSLRIGMTIRNFSPQVKYQQEAFELPLTFVIGTAMDLMDLVSPGGNSAFLLSVDAVHPRDYTERIHLGGEYWFRNIIAVRAGYKFNYDEESLTAGFGLNYEVAGVGLKIDYSYGEFGVFNAVNRFTVGLSY